MRAFQHSHTFPQSASTTVYECSSEPQTPLEVISQKQIAATGLHRYERSSEPRQCRSRSDLDHDTEFRPLACLVMGALLSLGTADHSRTRVTTTTTFDHWPRLLCYERFTEPRHCRPCLPPSMSEAQIHWKACKQHIERRFIVYIRSTPYLTHQFLNSTSCPQSRASTHP